MKVAKEGPKARNARLDIEDRGGEFAETQQHREQMYWSRSALLVECAWEGMAELDGLCSPAEAVDFNVDRAVKLRAGSHRVSVDYVLWHRKMPSLAWSGRQDR